jgi:hypothetical protein
MIKNEETLEEHYENGMAFLLYIFIHIMDIYDEEDREYKTYADLAKLLANELTENPENIPDFQKTIDDLKTIAAKEMDSWEEIEAYVNIAFKDANDVKAWLEAEVIPVLEAEGRKRGWIK